MGAAAQDAQRGRESVGVQLYDAQQRLAAANAAREAQRDALERAAGQRAAAEAALQDRTTATAEAAAAAGKLRDKVRRSRNASLLLPLKVRSVRGKAGCRCSLYTSIQPEASI